MSGLLEISVFQILNFFRFWNIYIYIISWKWDLNLNMKFIFHTYFIYTGFFLLTARKYMHTLGREREREKENIPQ